MTPEPLVSLWPDPKSLGTVTDLYELTMMAGYHASGMAGEPATFEVFVRRLPPNRSYLFPSLLGTGRAVRLSCRPVASRANHPPRQACLAQPRWAACYITIISRTARPATAP